MGITVLGRKLQIDGNRAAADPAAYEDPAAYHKGGDVWHFVDLKDAAGRIARIAVIRNGGARGRNVCKGSPFPKNNQR